MQYTTCFGSLEGYLDICFARGSGVASPWHGKAPSFFTTPLVGVSRDFPARTQAVRLLYPCLHTANLLLGACTLGRDAGIAAVFFPAREPYKTKPRRQNKLVPRHTNSFFGINKSSKQLYE